MASAADAEQLSYDDAIAGRRVQADGGSIVDSARSGFVVTAAAREAFEGILTGRRLDIGDPPWRWLEIGDLSEKPAGFDAQTVWCDETFVYFLDD
jgi:hypothetical protein